MTKSIVEFVKEHYPDDERMLKWAIAMDNQPKDWSNFLLVICFLLAVAVVNIIILKQRGII